MTRLEELIYSLTTVIIRYHDCLSAVKLIVAAKPELRAKSREYAINIICDPKTDFKERLESLIKACTVGYPGRRPFLNYILNEIVFLKANLDKQNSFTDAEFDEYKDQVYKLFIDFKFLLETVKGSTCNVTFHKTESGPGGIIALSGLINDGYTGGDFCNSGAFLKKEVLGTLNIAISCPVDKLKEFTDQICLEHQNTLVIPESISKIHDSKKIIADQAISIEALTNQFASAQVTLSKELESSQEKDELIRQQARIIQQQAETIEQQAERNKQLEEKNRTQEQLLDTQKKQLTRNNLPTLPGLGTYPTLFAFSRFQNTHLSAPFQVEPEESLFDPDGPE